MIFVLIALKYKNLIHKWQNFKFEAQQKRIYK